MTNTANHGRQPLAGLLLLAGTALFLWGGGQHPPTGPSLGVVGSEEYFRNFAAHVLRHAGWERIHGAILAGPVLWALGVAAARGTPGSRGAAGSLAIAALGIGSTLWAVAFVLDGFVALRHARSFAAGASAALPAFAANQLMVVRLGLVSWLLVGTGMAALGAEMLAARWFPRAVRLSLGGAGVALGAWPFAAWAGGLFEPGPFTSVAWVPTAVLTALWFAALAGVLLAGRRRAAPGVRG